MHNKSTYQISPSVSTLFVYVSSSVVVSISSLLLLLLSDLSAVLRSKYRVCLLTSSSQEDIPKYYIILTPVRDTLKSLKTKG